MLAITAELAELLSAVNRPGDFFVSGTAEMLAPQLEVEGVGRIALPLLPIQAEQLIAVAERAPYGRGESTLTDPSVRRTWQISADPSPDRGQALGANHQDDPGPRRGRAWGGRANRGRVLQTAVI